jgi:uncharacterized membrane protein YbhN (UPF0104 family)
MARANYLWLVLACMLFGVTYMLAAVRWWFLMRVQKINVSLRVAAALTLIGQFYNSFMLGSIGGDIVKVVYLQKYAPRQKTHAAPRSSWIGFSARPSLREPALSPMAPDH